MDLSDKRVYITGGSSGIGLATARALALEGCHVLLFARNQGKLDTAIRDVETFRRDAERQKIDAVSMDVADPADVEQKISMAVESFGTPDVLINSAGIGVGDYFENISYEQFDRLMKINLYGTRNTIHSVLPYMKTAGKGHIVNLSSMAGLVGMPGYTLYSSSKYALVGFSECLRSELRTYNIHLSLVCPPEVVTPLIEEEAKTLPPESRAVKNFAGLLKPEHVAGDIVRAIRKKKFLVVPGFLAKMTFLFHRLTNGHSSRLISNWVVSWVRWRLGNKGA